MPTRRRSSALVLAFATALAAPAMAEIDAGAYLAAHVAGGSSDFSAAARYYSRALSADPGNRALTESALLAFVGLGQVDKAVPLARVVAGAADDSQAAFMVMLAHRALSGDWDGMGRSLAGGQRVGPLFDGLARGWSLVGQGDRAGAEAAFDTVAQEERVMAFALYHKALALASLGAFADADRVIVSGGLGLTRRGALAHAQILSQLGRNADALAVLKQTFGGRSDAVIADLAARLAAGDRVDFDIVRNANDGMAETYYSIAKALNGDASDSYTLLYARIARYLRPDHVDAAMLAGALLSDLGRDDLATLAFGEVPAGHAGRDAAEAGQADALRAMGRDEEAMVRLRALIDRNPDNPSYRISVGDVLRSLERYDEAAVAYDSAIALYSDERPEHWRTYFVRGISFERTGQWDKAEADLRKALALNPDQPQVLNYLGYSLVEMRAKLDEALAMIERAAAAQPESGYITDSLGWVLYRLGRFAEAVEPMERAVQLMPVDAVVNDHLGDVYWMVGRRLEAEFQWRRALSFVDQDDSGEADPDRIRQKLDIGLDAVLSQETDVADDGG